MEIIELIMGIEERFNVEIADEDAVTFVTIGDMHRYLCGVLLAGGTRRTSALVREFNFVRRAVIETCAVPRWFVKPSTALDAVLPAFPVRRRHVLRRLQNRLGITINGDPGEVITLGTVVRQVAAHREKNQRFVPEVPLEGWSAGAIWAALREVVVKQLEVKPAQVTPEARIIDDLGCE